MDVQNLFLVLAWLVVAPFANAADVPAPAWQPPAAPDSSAPPALDTPHLYVERLHERWLPPRFDWTAPRDFALGMMCDLGLVTLALMDCHGWVAAEPAEAGPGVLILTPARPGAGGPDFRELQRRSVEERMHSI